MADKQNKLPENAPGRFFVDDQCIDCDACRETAPKFFRISQIFGAAGALLVPNQRVPSDKVHGQTIEV